MQVGVSRPPSRQACIFCPPKRGGAKEGAKITADDAIAIFRARSPHAAVARHPTLGNDLANEYGISAKAVRDIWGLRTWWTTTRPFWSASDHKKFRSRYPNMQACARCINHTGTATSEQQTRQQGTSTAALQLPREGKNAAASATWQGASLWPRQAPLDEQALPPAAQDRWGLLQTAPWLGAAGTSRELQAQALVSLSQYAPEATRLIYRFQQFTAVPLPPVLVFVALSACPACV